MITVEEDKVTCCYCGARVPRWYADEIGERIGPDLIAYTEYACEACTEEEYDDD